MANKPPKKLASTEYDSDDDFNFDDDSFDFGEFGAPERDRKPADKFKSGVVEGFKAQIYDPDMYKDMIKSQFPDSYGTLIDGGEQAVGAISDVYRAASKAFKPAVKDLKRIVKLSTPLVDKVLPKGMAAKVKEWSEPEKRYGMNQGDMAESMLTAELGSIFAAQAKDNAEQRAEDATKENVQQGVDQLRHTDLIGNLKSIRESTARLAAYQDNVLVNYQRKSLEISMRSYALQAEDSRITRSWMETVRATTEDIKKNTALPDFVKRLPTEDFKAAARNRLIGKSLNLIGSNTGFIKKWGEKTAEMVSQNMRGLVEGFSMGAGSALDAFEGGGDPSMAPDPMDLMGNLAGGAAGEMLGKYVGGKVLTPVSDSKSKAANSIRKLGFTLAEKLITFKDQMRRKIQNGEDSDSALMKFMAATMPTGVDRLSIQTHTTANLQQAAMFDVQSRRTLIEAIPGYFSRVLRELQIIRTGNVNIGLTRFDFASGKFLGDSEFKNKLFKSIVSDEAIASQRSNTDRILDTIDPDKKLSKEARDALHEQFMGDREKGTGRTNNEFMNAATYSGSASTHAHQIAQTFRNYFGLADGVNFTGTDKDTEASRRKSLQIQNMFQNVGKYSTIDPAQIQTLYNSGAGQDLEQMGIIKGNEIDNEKLVEYLSGKLKFNAGADSSAVGFYGQMNQRPEVRGRSGVTPQPAAPQPTKPSKPGNRKSGMHRRQGGYINFGPNDTTEEETATLPPQAITAGTNPSMDGRYFTDAQYAPRFTADAGKDIIDAIRANSTKSATELMLERITGIFALEQSSNEALWKIADGHAGAGGETKKGIIRRGGSALGRGLRFGGRQFYREGKLAIRGLGKLGGHVLGFGARQIGKIPSRIVSTAKAIGGGISSLWKWKKEVADVFYKDNVEPILSSAKILAGEYYDAVSGKVIQSLKDIKGTVVDKWGEIVIKGKDLIDTWVAMPTVKEKWEKIKASTMSTYGTVKGILTGKIYLSDVAKKVYNAGMGRLKRMGNSISDFVSNPFQDVYRIDDLSNPLLKGEDIRAGKYFTTKPDGSAGDVLKSVFEIATPITGVDGNQVITSSDITTGLCDKHGKKFITKMKRAKGLLDSFKNKAMFGVSSIKNILSGTLSGASNFIGEIFGATGFTNTSRRTTNTLLQIRNLLDDRLPGQRIGYSDNLNDFLPETGVRAKAAWAGIKGKFDTAKNFLKRKFYGDGDGDGIRDGSFADLLRRKKQQAGQFGTKVLGAATEAKKKVSEFNLIGKLTSVLGGVASSLSNLKILGPALGLFAKVVGPLAGLMGLGGAAAAGTAAATTGTAAVVGASAAAGVTAGTAGAAAAGTAAAGAAAAGTGVMAGIGAAAAALAVPVAIGIAVLGAGYGLYRFGNYLSRTNLTVASKLRMLQYGVDYQAEPDKAQTLLEFEELCFDAIKIDGSEVSIDKSKFKIVQAYNLFGINKDNKAEKDAFQQWIHQRFMPVFSASMLLCERITQSKRLTNLDKAKKEQVIAYFHKAKIISANYSYLNSPWPGDNGGGWFTRRKSLPIDTEKLRVGILKLESELPSLKDNKAERSLFGTAMAAEPPKSIDSMAKKDGERKAQSSQLRSALLDAVSKDLVLGSPVSITASNAQPLIDFGAVASELLSIRMRAYGMTSLEPSKVEQIAQLEKAAADNIAFKGDVAEYTASAETTVARYGKIFGINFTGSKEASDFVVWCMYRFIPVYLAALTSAKRYTGKTSLAAAFVTLKPEHVILTADSMIAASSGQGGNVWKITQSPWHNYILNTDAASVDVYLSNLKVKVKEASMIENNVKLPAKTQSKVQVKPAQSLTQTLKVAAEQNAAKDAPTDAEHAIKATPVGGAGGIPMASGALASGADGMKWISISKGVNFDGLNGEFKKNLLAMAEEYGTRTGKLLEITSAHRSYDEQARLYATLPAGKAAKPGSSLHEFGLAVDADPDTLNAMDKLGLMRKYGFTRPVGQEPWHVEPAGIQSNLNKFKTDVTAANQAVKDSIGGGGGGYGTLPDAQKYRRDYALASSLFNHRTPIATGTSVAAQMPSSATPVMAGDSNSTPTKTAAGAINDVNKTVQKTVQSVDVERHPEGGGDSQASSVSGGGGGAETGWEDNHGYVGNVNKLKANGAQYAQTPGPDAGSSGWKAFKETITSAAKSTGVPVKWMAAKAAVESGFKSAARNAKGSASGLYQFIQRTWDSMMSKYARKYGIPEGTPATDPKANAIMAGLYMKEIQKQLSGVVKNFGPVEAYLGHLLGPDGARRFFTALNNSPDTPVNTVVSQDAFNGNASYFVSNGRVLSVKESYDQIASNYQSKYSAFGIEADLGPLTLNSNAVVTSSNKQPEASSLSSYGAGPIVQTGYKVAPKPTASATQVYTGGNKGAVSDDIGNAIADISAGAKSGTSSAYRSFVSPQSNANPTGSADSAATTAKNTTDMLVVMKDELSILGQIRDLMNKLVSLPSQSKSEQAPAPAQASAPVSASARSPMDQTPRASISMKRNI